MVFKPQTFHEVPPQVEIANHPAIAFDLLVFKAAKGILSNEKTHDGPEVIFRQNWGGTVSKDASDFVRAGMDVVRDSLPLDWSQLDTEAEQFIAFQQLTEYQKHALLDFCVASTLQPKLAPTSSDRITAGTPPAR